MEVQGDEGPEASILVRLWTRSLGLRIRGEAPRSCAMLSTMMLDGETKLFERSQMKLEMIERVVATTQTNREGIGRFSKGE